MDNISLSYPSLQCVLQYIEANRRFQLSHQALSIRSAEKAAPLHINDLGLYSNRFIVNDFVYKLGIIRKFTNGVPPTWIQTYNKFGGVHRDLDEFGGNDKSCDKVMTPGDLLMKYAGMVHEEMDEEDENAHMIRRERELETLKREKPMDYRIELYEAELFSWQHRRLGMRPQYDSYIQFTVTKPDDEKVFERMEYNKKVYQAMKYLSNKIFGKRKVTINVGTLSLVHTNNCVLRLPENMKLRIRKLEIHGNVAELMDSLDHIIDRRSFPLRKVRIMLGKKFVQPQNHDHPIIKTAKSLCIPGGDRVPDAWFDVFLKLPNPKIRVEFGDYAPDKFVYLIENLLKKKREIGTSYVFHIWEQENITKLFKTLKRHQKAKVFKDPRHPTFPFRFVFPINDSLKMDVFCTENPRHVDEARAYTSQLMLWMNFQAREPKMIGTKIKQTMNNKLLMVTGSIVAVIIGFIFFNFFF